MPIELSAFGRSLVEGSKPKPRIELSPTLKSLVGDEIAETVKETPETQITPVKMEGRTAIPPKPSIFQNIINSPVGDVATLGMSEKEVGSAQKKFIDEAKSGIKDFVTSLNPPPGSDAPVRNALNMMNLVFTPAIKTARGIGGLAIPEQGKTRLQSALKDIIYDPGAGVYGKRIRESMNSPKNEAEANAQALAAGLAGTAAEVATFTPKNALKAIEGFKPSVAGATAPELAAQVKLDLASKVENVLPKIKETLKTQFPNVEGKLIDELTADKVIQRAQVEPAFGNLVSKLAKDDTMFAYSGLPIKPEKLIPKTAEDVKAIVPAVVPKIESPQQQEQNALEFKASSGGLNRGLAMSSHAGTSFSPEKRGQQEIEGFVQEVQSVYDDLKSLAKTPEQLAVLKEEMERFQAGYAAKENDRLRRHGSIMSSMITGPANFPSSRMRKKSESLDNYMKDESEWKQRAINSIKRKLKEQKIEAAGGEVEFKKQELAKLEQNQETMKAVNKIVKSKVDDSDKIKAIMAVHPSLKQEHAEALLKPDFAGRLGFAGYQLTNNNAKIRMMRQRIAELETKGAKPSSEIPFEGGKIVDNADLDRVQIIHDVKPAQEVIQALKSKGFRWSPENKAWQRKRTNSAMYDAQNITGAKSQQIHPPITPIQPSIVEPSANVAKISPTEIEKQQELPAEPTKSLGHIAFIKDRIGVDRELIARKDGNIGIADVSNAIDMETGNRNGARQIGLRDTPENRDKAIKIYNVVNPREKGVEQGKIDLANPENVIDNPYHSQPNRGEWFEGHAEGRGARLVGKEGANIPSEQFDQTELQKGIKHEMEHTDDPIIAERIAKDHIAEHADYYTKLEQATKKMSPPPENLAAIPPVKPPVEPPVATSAPMPEEPIQGREFKAPEESLGAVPEESKQDLFIEPMTPEELAQAKAEVEIEAVANYNNKHPLEEAMFQIGKIKRYAKGKEAEEQRDIPRRFLTNASTASTADQFLSMLRPFGFDFKSESELFNALKELGEKGRGLRLSAETQKYLKDKKNVERVEKALSTKLAPGSVRRIINSYTGVKPHKTGTVLATTEEKFLKWVMKERQKYSKIGEQSGYKEGVKIGEARKENVLEGKIESVQRKAELDALKQDIKSRDKLSSTVGELENKWENLEGALKRKAELTRLKDDIISRTKIGEIKEGLKSMQTYRDFLVDYVNEKLPPRLRFKLLTDIRDVKTPKQLGDAILKIENIADEEIARIEKAKSEQRFTPQQRKELYQQAYTKGLILKTENGQVKNRLDGLLTHYKDATFQEVKDYISELQGDQSNPPKILKLYGDINTDREAMALINKLNPRWVDINEVELNTLDAERIMEKVTGLDAWDADNILGNNVYDVLAGADAARFDEFNRLLKELHESVGGMVRDTKISAESMRKAENGEPLDAKEQKAVDYIRSMNEKLFARANEVRAKLGRKPIRYRQNYLTHMREFNELMKMFNGDIDKIQGLTTEQLDAIRKSDFTKPNATPNPFAKQRKGPRTKYDLIGNYEKYLETMLSEIYLSPAIKHSRKFIEYALLNQPTAFKALSRLLDDLAGKPSRIDELMKPVVSNKVVKWLRGQIAKNALIANINFNLVNMANISTNIGELGVYSLKGLQAFLGNKELRQLAFKYSSVLQSRKSQFDADVKAISVFNPDSLKGLSATEMARVGYQQLRYLAEGLTRIIEYNNVGSTWCGAYMKGVQVHKMTPERAMRYADAIAKKTQTGYRAYELPAVMRSDTGKLFLQFQSWTFNAMNYLIYDMKLGNIPKQVLPGVFNEKNRPRTVEYRKFFLLIGTLMLVNEFYRRRGWREPTSLTSAMPRTSFPVGRVLKDVGTITGADNIIKQVSGGTPSKHKPETIKKATTRLLSSVAAPFGGAQLGRFLTGSVLPKKDTTYAKREVIGMYVDALKSKNKGKLAEADNEANKQGIVIKEARKAAMGRVVSEIADVYEEALQKKSLKLLQKADAMTGGSAIIKEKARKQAATRIKNEQKKSRALFEQQTTYIDQPERGALEKAKDLIKSW